MDPNTEAKQSKKWKVILSTGFYAGIIWGTLDILNSYLKFTKITPAAEWVIFFNKEFVHSIYGYGLSIIVDILFSILAAALYAYTLLRLRGPWVGIAYGIIWGGLMIGLVGPMFKIIPPIWKIDIHSLVTEISNFTLWGLFIGYTLVVELRDEQGRRGMV